MTLWKSLLFKVFSYGWRAMPRQERSGGDQAAFPLPPSCGHIRFLPAIDPWRRPRDRQLDLFSIRKEAPRRVAVRKLGSLGLWFFRCYEFAGPLPLPAPCGSAHSPCRTVHALKIPLVSLSAWVVFLTNGGTSVDSLTKYLFIICDMLGTGHGTKDREAPLSPGTYQPMAIVKLAGDFRLW